MILVWAALPAHAIRPTEGGLFAFDPTDVVATFDEPSGLVRVHYSTSGPNLVKAGDLDADGIPDFVTDAAEVAVGALTLYGDTGFRAPLAEADLGLGLLGGSEALDVYLIDFALSADGNYGVDDCTAAPVQCSGFLSVENDFSGYGYASPRAGLEVVVPHEIFHGVQMAYSGELEVWVAEGTAVWAERLWDPEVRDFFSFASHYLEEPTRSIDEPPVGPVAGFAYGTALFWDFLTLRHDSTLMVELLESWEGQTEFLTPTLRTIEARGDTIPEMWEEFATFNLATGGQSGGLEGYPYADRLVPPPLEATGELLDDDNRFYPLATTYYRLNHPGGELWFGFDAAAPELLFSLHPTIDGTRDGPVGPAVVSFRADDPGPVSVGDLPKGQYFVWGAQPDDGEASVKVRFCAGPEDRVLDCFGLLPEEELPVEEPEKGCGCATTGSAAWWVVVPWLWRGRTGARARRHVV